MKKNFITGIVVGGILFGSAGAFAGYYTATDNVFPIQLNGNNVNLTGYNIEGSTYFKLREIADVVGGFTVDFQDNTIQLAKDGYTYQSLDIKIPERVESVPYYDRPSWCPDFGAYTGAILREPTDGTSFIYDTNTHQVNSYFGLLQSLGYQKGTMPDSPLVYVKDDCFISFVYRPELTPDLVAFVAGAGDWVQSQFVPDTQSSTTVSNSVAYYSDVAWCPDFGSCTGATLLEHATSDLGVNDYVYSATSQNLKSYIDLLYSLGFSKGTIPELGEHVVYESNNYPIYTFALNDYAIFVVDYLDFGHVGIIAHEYDWVSDKFIPES